MNKLHSSLAFLSIVLLSFAGLFFILEDPGAVGFAITGAITARDLAPDSFEYETAQEATAQSVETKLSRALAQIERAEEAEFSTNFSRDLFAEALSFATHENYSLADENAEIILFVVSEQFRLQERISSLENRLTEIASKNPDFESSTLRQQLLQAGKEFRLEQIDQARANVATVEQRLQEQGLLNTQFEGVLELSKTFLQRYWKETLVTLLLVILLSIPLARAISRHRLKRKIARMKLSMKKYEQNLKDLQRSCFVTKKISVEEYRENARLYERKLRELEQQLPVYQSRLSQNSAKQTKDSKAAKGVLVIRQQQHSTHKSQQKKNSSTRRSSRKRNARK